MFQGIFMRQYPSKLRKTLSSDFVEWNWTAAKTTTLWITDKRSCFKRGQKGQMQAISLIMPFFLHILTNNNCLENFLTNCRSNLLLLTYHYLLMKCFWLNVCHKQLCSSPIRLISFNVKWYFSFKKYIFSPSSVFLSS